MTDDELLRQYPPRAPGGSLVWTAVVDVSDRIELGQSPLGARFMVPIAGGRFYGGPGHDGLTGKVLAGGADRQLVRPDGVKELDALYEMETECGTRITVRNRVLVDEARKPERYAMSVIDVQVPDGPFEWLRRRLLVGTLQSARPDRPAVVVRAWEMDLAGA